MLKNKLNKPINPEGNVPDGCNGIRRPNGSAAFFNGGAAAKPIPESEPQLLSGGALQTYVQMRSIAAQLAGNGACRETLTAQYAQDDKDLCEALKAYGVEPSAVPVP